MFDRNFDIPAEIESNTYVVGGAVRDALLGNDPEDFDFVVANTDPEVMERLGFEEVGVSNFPVFLNEDGEEFALARSEVKDGDGYKGFDLQLGVDLHTDLERRDLTVNAIAFDVQSGEIVDPFGGQEDLNNQVLRHVSEAFAEDPVRVLRLARFASRLPEFKVAEDTLELAETVAPELEAVPAERVGAEVKKTFKQASSPRRFFDVALQVGALDVVAPEVARLDDVPAGPEEHHAEGSAFEHTMRVLEEYQSLDPNNVRGLAGALSHDLGKGITNPETLPHHYNHGQRGIDVAKSLASNLRLSNDIAGAMVCASRQHSRVRDLLDMKESKVLRLLQELQSGKSLDVDELLKIAKADCLGREPSKLGVDFEAIENLLSKASDVLEDVDGNTVKQRFPDKTGKAFGQILEQERARELKHRR